MITTIMALAVVVALMCGMYAVSGAAPVASRPCLRLRRTVEQNGLRTLRVYGILIDCFNKGRAYQLPGILGARTRPMGFTLLDNSSGIERKDWFIMDVFVKSTAYGQWDEFKHMIGAVQVSIKVKDQWRVVDASAGLPDRTWVKVEVPPELQVRIVRRYLPNIQIGDDTYRLVGAGSGLAKKNQCVYARVGSKVATVMESMFCNDSGSGRDIANYAGTLLTAEVLCVDGSIPKPDGNIALARQAVKIIRTSHPEFQEIASRFPEFADDPDVDGVAWGMNVKFGVSQARCVISASNVPLAMGKGMLDIVPCSATRAWLTEKFGDTPVIIANDNWIKGNKKLLPDECDGYVGAIAFPQRHRTSLDLGALMHLAGWGTRHDPERVRNALDRLATASEKELPPLQPEFVLEMEDESDSDGGPRFDADDDAIESAQLIRRMAYAFISRAGAGRAMRFEWVRTAVESAIGRAVLKAWRSQRWNMEYMLPSYDLWLQGADGLHQVFTTACRNGTEVWITRHPITAPSVIQKVVVSGYAPKGLVYMHPSLGKSHLYLDGDYDGDTAAIRSVNGSDEDIIIEEAHRGQEGVRLLPLAQEDGVEYPDHLRFWCTKESGSLEHITAYRLVHGADTMGADTTWQALAVVNDAANTELLEKTTRARRIGVDLGKNAIDDPHRLLPSIQSRLEGWQNTRAMWMLATRSNWRLFKRKDVPRAWEEECNQAMVLLPARWITGLARQVAESLTAQYGVDPTGATCAATMRTPQNVALGNMLHAWRRDIAHTQNQVSVVSKGIGSGRGAKDLIEKYRKELLGYLVKEAADRVCSVMPSDQRQRLDLAMELFVQGHNQEFARPSVLFAINELATLFIRYIESR